MQVLVKLTGNGRRMAAVAADCRRIGRAGRPDIGDDRCVPGRARKRLNRREADLRGWRASFAEKPRRYGITGPNG